MKTFYENYWEKIERSGNRPRYHIFSGWIENGSRVLDIGCGDGYFGELLVRDKGVAYTGIDISDAALKAALKAALTRGLNVIQLDASSELDKFQPGSFDFVVMSEFIEHIPNSEKILKIAGKIAKKVFLYPYPTSLIGNFDYSFYLAISQNSGRLLPKNTCDIGQLMISKKLLKMPDLK